MTSRLRLGVIVCGALLALTGSASAQVNTGTVLGTVKDAQGGVIPGATVTLISEARGTRSAPVVTNDERRLRLPERHRRHLHHRGQCSNRSRPRSAPASP